MANEILDWRPGLDSTWEITQTEPAFESINRVAAGDAWLGAPVHVHPTATESYEVLEGRLEVLVGKQWRTVDAGEKVSVPPGTAHTLRGVRGVAVSLVNTHSPALEFERFFRALHRLVSSERIKLPPKDPRSLMLLAMLFAAYPAEQRILKPPQAVIGALAFLGRRVGLRLDD